MDNPYEALRQQARERRDKIILNARKEYRQAARRIDDLRKQMTGEARPAILPPHRAKERTLSDVLLAVLPKDRPFTSAEVCELVSADPIGFMYKQNSIRTQLATMAELGLFRRVGRRDGYILWVSAESAIDPGPYGAMTIAEIAESLIGEFGPLRVAEMGARMRERGYRPDEPMPVTHNLLRSAMTRISGRFVKDVAGRWMVAAGA